LIEENPEFMKAFIECIFKEGERISIINEDERVVVFWFNSCKFDINNILTPLIESGYKIDSLLDLSTQQKQMILSYIGYKSKLVFKDLRAFTSCGSLADTVKNFGITKLT
jgi:hypothetical protein